MVQTASTTFLGASLVASFLGGALALFAPCCISFLFPSYFATAFKTKSKIFFMTFVYFLGLAIILVPIGLGVNALSQLFSNYHKEVFLIGGIFLIFLSILTLFGKTIPLPFKVRADFKNKDISSIFILGLISGAASSCCTPVLIGVLTITALSASFWYALLLSLTYVLGMVFPLLILSYFWDKFDFSQARFLHGKTFEFSILGRKHYLHSSHLISAIILAAMGILIVVLSLGNNTWTPAKYMSFITNLFGKITAQIIEKSKFVPENLWIAIFLILFIGIIYLAFKRKEEL